MVTEEELAIKESQHPLLRELDKKLGATFTGVKDGFLCYELPTKTISKEEIKRQGGIMAEGLYDGE